MGEPPVMETQEESGVELSPPVRQAERSLLLRWGGGRSSFGPSASSPSDSSSKNPLVAAAVLMPEPEQQQLAPITGITLVCSDLGELVPRGFDLLRGVPPGLRGHRLVPPGDRERECVLPFLPFFFSCKKLHELPFLQLPFWKK